MASKNDDGAGAAALLAVAREAHRIGNDRAALAAVTQALEQLSTAESWDLKGDILLALGQTQRAVEAYGRAVDLAPAHAVYLHDLGRSLLRSGRPQEAEARLTQAIALKPGAWDIFCDLGSAQLEQGNTAAALNSFSFALAVKPDAAIAHFNQGNALLELGLLDKAEISFQTAIDLKPNFLSALMSLATLLSDLGRLPEAEPIFALAKTLAPHSPLFNQAYALARLRYGQLPEGFAAYESRFQPSRYALPVRPFQHPRWQGEDLSGRNILIWTEQGLGDEILSANMFADVIARARSCTIECSERIAPLFQRSFASARVVTRRDPPDPATSGPFDFQIPALSLGRFLRPNDAAFPKHTGYLRADDALRGRVRERYKAQNRTDLVVGLSWDSTARHGSRKRLPLEYWRPILELPGLTFVSLQYGVAPDDPEINRLELKNLTVDGDINAHKSLDGSAAQVAAVDLVITVSNTTAHLAGAQNIPVWTLLPDGPGCFWYWFRDRQDSPWYPSMRMFRQPRPGAWVSVIGAVEQALVEMRGEVRL